MDEDGPLVAGFEKRLPPKTVCAVNTARKIAYLGMVKT